jgi:endonuclease-3 related protein
MEDKLLDIYRRLFDRYGPQGWWPGNSAFEVMVGAILTQSAAWANVEKALDNLKRAHLLSPAGIRKVRLDRLARLVYPSGYYRVKASKLKALVAFLYRRADGDLRRLFHLDLATLRQELLGVYGIGPETADSILLYAAEKPIFVVDAYTRRIVYRLGLASANARYEALQTLFMDNLPHDVALFNEYHALLVRLGKEVCRRKPRCAECSLREICPAPHRA